MSTTKPSARWRLRATHRKMSFETFERTVPIRPGWKREYYGGMAHVRPSWTRVTFELDVASRPAIEPPGLRPVSPDDAPAILDAFLDSFRVAPEYADYPLKAYRKQAAEYVAGFFGGVRGTWSPTSAAVAHDGRIIAAALVKDRDPKPPLLDCLLVRPAHFRQGLANAVATRAVNGLAAAGIATLRSSAMLANEASLGWHAAFGFRELPDYFVAQARCYCASFERQRLEKAGLLTDAERARLTALFEQWRAELDRLDALPFDQRHPELDD